MTASVILAGAWDFASYGTSTLSLTDDTVSGASVSFSTGKYDHGFCVKAGVTSPSITTWGTALENALMAASPTRTYHVTLNPHTGKYLLECEESNFDITFTAAAGTRMQKLLGFIDNPHSTNSYTGFKVPYFAILPAKPGPADYLAWTAPQGTTKEVLNDAGNPYRLAPTSVLRMSSWSHQFEPKDRVDADWLASLSLPTSTHYYSWPQLFADFQLAQLPIGMRIEDAAGNYENVAFSLRAPEYDQAALQRQAKSYDGYWKVAISARMWGVSTRTFNA